MKDVLALRVSLLDLNYNGYLHNTFDNKTLGGVNDLVAREDPHAPDQCV